MRDNRRTILAVIAIIVMVAIAAGVFWMIRYEHKREQYRVARSLLDQGYYRSASDAFNDVGDFQNAKEYGMYCAALAAGENGEYETAIGQLKAMGGFSDSDAQAKYYTARQLESEADDRETMEKALEIYREIDTISDSAERARLLEEKLYADNGEDEPIEEDKDEAVQVATPIESIPIRSFTGVLPEETVTQDDESDDDEFDVVIVETQQVSDSNDEEPSTDDIAEVSEEETEAPTAEPMLEAAENPTAEPMTEATEAPVEKSMTEAAEEPTAEPNVEATETPTEKPAAEAAETPAAETTVEATEAPTAEPTIEATETPAAETTVEATEAPTAEPTAEATEAPAAESTVEATEAPTAEPTIEATKTPAAETTVEATEAPTAEPTIETTATPVAEPIVETTDAPSEEVFDDDPVIDQTEEAAESDAEDVVETESAESNDDDQTHIANAEGPIEGTVIGAEIVNIRKEPNTSAPIMGGIITGDKVTIDYIKDGWAKIVTEGGVEGFVSSNFLKYDARALESSPDGITCIVKAEPVLFVRVEPDANAQIVRYLPDKTEVLVTEYTDNGWAKIYYNGYRGYVNADYLVEK